MMVHGAPESDRAIGLTASSELDRKRFSHTVNLVASLSRRV